MKARLSGRSLRLTVSVLVLVLLLSVSGSVALAAGAQTPILGGTPKTGSIMGDDGGAFANYIVNYPGNSFDLRIQVVFGPHDPVFSPDLGFVVYGPNGFQNSGAFIDSPNVTLELSYAQADAAQLFVQIYNYAQGVNVSYTAIAKGIAATAPAPSVARAPAAAPVAAAAIAPAVNDSSLAGSAGGAYAKFSFASSGDGSQATATLWFAPDDPQYAGQMGFQVIDPNNNVIAVGANTGTAPGLRQAGWNLTVAGNYMIEIYNYADGVAMPYMFNIAQ